MYYEKIIELCQENIILREQINLLYILIGGKQVDRNQVIDKISTIENDIIKNEKTIKALTI